MCAKENEQTCRKGKGIAPPLFAMIPPQAPTTPMQRQKEGMKIEKIEGVKVYRFPLFAGGSPPRPPPFRPFLRGAG